VQKYKKVFQFARRYIEIVIANNCSIIRSYFLLFALSFSGKKNQKKDAATIRAMHYAKKRLRFLIKPLNKKELLLKRNKT
jgi:hypothetical protein